MVPKLHSNNFKELPSENISSKQKQDKIQKFISVNNDQRKKISHTFSYLHLRLNHVGYIEHTETVFFLLNIILCTNISVGLFLFCFFFHIFVKSHIAYFFRKFLSFIETLVFVSYLSKNERLYKQIQRCLYIYEFTSNVENNKHK